jgi:hypothetical protein
MFKISGYRVNKKFYPIFLVIFLALFLNLWIIPGVEGTGGERNPFALPAGVQKGRTLEKKEGAGPVKVGRESAPGFRVTTILISGRTKVAAINGVLRQKGDEVSGYKILEIEDKQVVLSRGKEKLMINIDSGVGYSFKKLNSNIQVMGTSK